METLTQILERLARTFTVRDIMVTKEKLVCASTDGEAKRKLEEHEDFDSIPIVVKGEISAYFHRNTNQRHPIQLEDIISDATSILDLVDILKEREFCFILADNRIVGYVHFSDLNNSTVKIPFFVILEALERKLVDEIGSKIKEDNLSLVMDEKRSDTVKNRMMRMQKKRANFNWPTLLYFNEIIRFASEFGKIELKKNKIDLISKIRNLIAHAGDPLVEEHKHVKRLADAKDLCISLLKII